jgi:hypothetical protein
MKTLTITARIVEVGAKRGKHFVTLEVDQGAAAELAHAGLLYADVDATFSESDATLPKGASDAFERLNADREEG